MAYFARCYSDHVADFFDAKALASMDVDDGSGSFNVYWELAWYWHNRAKQGCRI